MIAGVMSDQKFKYDYFHYNKFFVLRPPLMLKVSLVLLCKDILLSLMMGASKFKRAARSARKTLVQPVFILSNLPAFILLLAMVMRTPKGGRWARVVWKNGQVMMALAVILYIATFIYLNGVDITRYSFIISPFLSIYSHRKCFRTRSAKKKAVFHDANRKDPIMTIAIVSSMNLKLYEAYRSSKNS